MKKTALITAYFGKFPDYFNLWLNSTRNNSDIDFIIYGDCDNSGYGSVPENVIFKKISFEELRKHVQSKFDFEITLDKPYKLCDYKPAYGYIFEEDLNGYDYWGHIDIDTVLGNLSAFFPDKDYDKLFLFGHMTLYRNTYENNRVFMRDGGMDYKKVFTTEFNMIFDELPGMSKKYDILGIEQYREAPFADIARRRLNFTLNEEITRPNYKYQIFYYDNGRIFRDYYSDGKIETDEFNYIHFSHRNPVDKTNGSNSFYVTRFGFIEKNSPATLEIIKQYNAPTPIQNIAIMFKVQVIRRIKRISKMIYCRLMRK